MGSYWPHWLTKRSLCALAVLNGGSICLWYLYVYICTGIFLYFLISWLFHMGSHWQYGYAKSSLFSLAVLHGGRTSAKEGSSAKFELISSFALASQSSFISYKKWKTNNLYDLTTSLMTSLNFHQLILHSRSVFANHHDSLNYIWTISAHTMDYIDAATSGTFFPHVLPVIDLQRMLLHIADSLLPMLHLPVSPDDTLHFYRYFTLTFWLKTNCFYYWLTYQFRIDYDKSPSMKSSPWAFPMKTT